MESYPGDLLVGFFPLVFAVNASVPSADDNPSSDSSGRSAFDRFLDAMAASLIDDQDDSNVVEPQTSSSHFRRGISSKGYESSDDELDGSHERRVSLRSIGSPSLVGRLGRNTSGDDATKDASNTSYAKALKHGQGFFQRARIVSASHKHGFPPSKDPDGSNNRLNALHQARTNFASGQAYNKQIKSILERMTLGGILSEGWLEKHVHALPSALMLVVRVSTSHDQAKQDSHLLETVEHLQYSLAPKRQCPIHIVALVADDLTVIQAEQWAVAIQQSLETELPLTLLRTTEDLHSNSDGFPTSDALRRLHKEVRDASLLYYLRQARRTKQKLVRLLTPRQQPVPPQLLPLAIRYCFKVGIFYEFQWKHEKSLKFMAEAYRYLQRYFSFLQTTTHDHSALNNSSSLLPISTTNPEMDDDSGVEVSLPSSPDQVFWNRVAPPPPDDMEYQCRTVADWLNFKLLQAGFLSHTSVGLLAAAHQWSKHAQVFCRPRVSSGAAPDWYLWSYIAQQRLVMSQLVERHPPRALGDLGNEYDEVLLLCSPWRAYESTAEAMLRVGRAVQREMAKNTHAHGPGEKDIMRKPFVGGLDSDWLAPKLDAESKINHREKAFELIQRALELFEYEMEKEKAKDTDGNYFRSWSRSGARLYYLAGGTLLGMGRYKEATAYLEKAANHVEGWSGLQVVIRRMLNECYEKYLPTEENESSSRTIASMILDSYFNAEMSSKSLRRALDNFATHSGGDTLKWHHDCIDEADSSLPFSFAVTFPGITHATAGDAVKASVLIRSNLDYAVNINSVVLLSMAGQIAVPSSDLLGATNADEGSGGGIIIQAKTSILFSTVIDLPKNVSAIAVDESGNGGEKMGTPGKGSFSKSARPRTAGITAAAGARLVSEKMFEASTRQANAQWSLCCLGGKSLRCDSIRMVFYPVHVGSTGKGCNIEVTILKQKRKTAAQIRRTPFEEDNYVASAWSRPHHLPLELGPRCLRVLGPMPEMTVTNITETATNGRAMEGTVNRILLRLNAGPNEVCSNIQFRVTCSSLIVTSQGITKNLTADSEEAKEQDGKIDMKNHLVRAPVLVRSNPDASAEIETDYGYKLPSGWALVGTGQGSYDDLMPVASTLKSGEAAFVYFDVFRPCSEKKRNHSLEQDANGEITGDELCQTNFDIAISYHQERPAKQRQRRAKRGARKRSSAAVDTDAEGVPDVPDQVTLDYTGTVVWTEPLSAEFSPIVRKGYPSGSRHPSNMCSPVETDMPWVGRDDEVSLVSGDKVSTKCVLQSKAASDGLLTELVSVSFEDDPEADPSCLITAVPRSSSKDASTLYESTKSDPCRKLGDGSRFSILYTVEAQLQNGCTKNGVTTSLGVLSVNWLPVPFEVPSEMKQNEQTVHFHGPLVLKAPLNLRFRGPDCYVENAPFEMKLESFPDAPKVAVPFQITYRIVNKTSIHQKLAIAVDESSEENKFDPDGLLMSGLMNGELSLGPHESQSLSYTMIAMRAGMAAMPKLSISSVRYKTWLVPDGQWTNRPLFVLP